MSDVRVATQVRSASAAAAQPQPRRQYRPAPAPRPALRLVTADESRRRAATRLWTALATVSACAAVFAVVALHVLLSQGQMDLDRLHDRADREAAVNRTLRVQVAELESPNRVVAAARQRLGMVPPASIVYLPAATGPLTGPPPAATAATATATATAAAATATATPTATPKANGNQGPTTKSTAARTTATTVKPTTANTSAATTTPARSTATTRPAGRAR
jgi:cell division protein FtsL